MAVRNNQSTVASAIESIIKQTYTNWEMILINDGSTDSSYDEMLRYRKSDSRIKLYSNDVTIGLAASLNRGIDKTRGSYIARMDADDLSVKTRLETQINYMEERRWIDVLGSNVIFLTIEGRETGISKLPLTAADITKLIPRMNPLVHPSVMIRKQLFDKVSYYDIRLKRKQDYDLWARAVNAGAILMNLEQPLLHYTVTKSKTMRTNLYGLFVRIRNGWRGGYLAKAIFWGVVVMCINIARYFGYKQKGHR